MSNKQLAIQCANAIQQILLKYFTMQVVAVKTHNASLAKDPHLQHTAQWINEHSPKNIVQADDTAWEEVKTSCSLGKELLLFKDAEDETLLIYWPTPMDQIPTVITNLHSLE